MRESDDWNGQRSEFMWVEERFVFLHIRGVTRIVRHDGNDKLDDGIEALGFRTDEELSVALWTKS